MPTLDDAFDAVRTALVERYGPTEADFGDLEPFEGMVAVYLDGALGGVRSRSALEGLRDEGLLDPERLADAEIPEISDALREKGQTVTSRVVAPLKHLARWAVAQGATGSSPMTPVVNTTASLEWLRGELGAIKGIGPAGADALVLFALKRPSYPVDRASFRVLVRHGWLDPTATYDEARELIVERAMDDVDFVEERAVRVLGDLSHGMAQLGRQFCRAASPHCERCPLEHLLPEGGPREGDA
jgi:endonuclease III related protein